MGIRGVYKEIGPGERIALSKLSVETFEKKGRPFRLAIDVSIWLFQIRSSKGGSNPAVRTFYYRLLRMISHNIHPLFVFDGPNKPPLKRNKITGPNIASIPEFLAKQLLEQFGLPFHVAPGEAEAECALLQRRGIVDAVLSEDVDTLMFGSGLTLRNLSAEGPGKSKVATHVNIYDANKTKSTSGLDREGMILVAIMSGGDYIPEGIPGCGPKTACDAARAGFGKELCELSQDDKIGLSLWKNRLKHELTTNEQNFFKTKHKALVIPDDFPRRDVLRYYTHPCLSSDASLDKLQDQLKWDQDIKFDALRKFTGDAFSWICIGGAKKFIRNLAPVLLVRQLRLRGQTGAALQDSGELNLSTHESALVKSIHGRRTHFINDNLPELRISFIPHELVPIDLTIEDPDPELPLDGLESDGEAATEQNDIDEPGEPSSPRKKRGPPTYDPTQLEKIWILETYVKIGVPLKAEEWAAVERDKLTAKAQQKPNASRPAASKKAPNGGMRPGALDQFTVSRKPRQETQLLKILSEPQPESSQFSHDLDMESTPLQTARPPPAQVSTSSPQKTKVSVPDVIDLLYSPPAKARQSRPFVRSQSDTSSLRKSRPNLGREEPQLNSITEAILDLPLSVTKIRPRDPFRRAQTMVYGDQDESLPDSHSSSSTPIIPHKTTMNGGEFPPPRRPTSPSPIQKRGQSTPKRSKGSALETISLLSSSPPSTPHQCQQSILNFLSPSPVRLAYQPKPNFDLLLAPVESQQLPSSSLDNRKGLSATISSRPVLAASSANNREPATGIGSQFSSGISTKVRRTSSSGQHSSRIAVASTYQSVESAGKMKPFRLPGKLQVDVSVPENFAIYQDEEDSVVDQGLQDVKKKRKSEDGPEDKGKRWRNSQVEVVDLTST